MNTAQLHPLPAVRALIEDADGRILIIRRANTDFGQGDWCLPGGKVDYGQTVEEALRREIMEELSQELVTAGFFFYQDSLPLVPGGPHFINFYFHCQVAGEMQLNEESSEFAWIGSADISRYHIVFRNDEALRRHFNSQPNHAAIGRMENHA
jgi:8-oxo-dGTP pyrophosphatase MutT (NUDIX family)